MNVQNGGNKGLFQLFKAMGGLQKAAVITAGVIIVGGGATAVTMAVLGARSVPVEAVSSDNVSSESLPVIVSSEEPSSVEPSSVEEISSEEPSSIPEVSSVAVSSQKPKPSSTASVASEKPKDPAKPSEEAVAALPEGYQEKYADYYKQNKDFVGWIKYTGKMDYPVVQTTDNSYYLNKTFTKGKSGWGTPYMDYRVSLGQSKNTIIWSHSNPKTGEMFQATKGLRKVDFYKQHPTLTFNDAYNDGTYKIIAYFVENTKSGNQTFAYQNFIDQTDSAYIDSFMAEAKKRSFINTTVDWNAEDTFLTLSTCWDTNTANWDRLVTVARKVRPGESASVDTSGATQNTSQQLPPGGLFSPKY